MTGQLAPRGEADVAQILDRRSLDRQILDQWSAR